MHNGGKQRMRSQKTQAWQAITVGSLEYLGDAAKRDNDVHDVRPFEEVWIPGPKTGLKFLVDFYRKSEGFTKPYKLIDILFTEHGPIYKENMALGKPAVYVIDPDDFEIACRAEGNILGRRLAVDVWVE